MTMIPSPVGKRKRIPLTPLIDVIFILIMFFLLSSSFGVWRPLEVSLGGRSASAVPAPSGAQNRPSVYIGIRKRPGQNGTVLNVNGVELPFEGLLRELDRLAGLGAETAILVPAEDTDFQNVVRVLDEARASRIKRVSLQLK